MGCYNWRAKGRKRGCIIDAWTYVTLGSRESNLNHHRSILPLGFPDYFGLDGLASDTGMGNGEKGEILSWNNDHVL